MRLATRSPSAALRLLTGLALCAATLLPGLADGRSPPRDDDERRHKSMAHPAPAMSYDFADSLGATPGGAQDISFFRDRVAATPAAEAFRFPDDGSWRSVTWQQVGDRVRLIAAGLIALGVAPEDRVALASSTRYEWVLADFSVLCAGAATTTLYPTTNARDVARSPSR